MVHNEQLFETLKEVDSETLARIIDKLDEAYHHNNIYVGDGDEYCDKIYELKDEREGLTAFLVIEEDGEVNWYFVPHPHSDFIVTERYVKIGRAEKE